jgi:hypothetical protein
MTGSAKTIYGWLIVSLWLVFIVYWFALRPVMHSA